MPTESAEETARRIIEAAREAPSGKPSFGRSLFFGRFRPELLDLVTKHADTGKFCETLRSFCGEHVDGPAIDREARVPDHVITGLKEVGAFGMRIPPEYGGLGLSYVEYHRALMIVASANASVATMLAAHQSTGMPQPLLLFGTPEQKARFLPRCARTDISAMLIAESDAGSDPTRLATTATPDSDGNYVVDGTKLWTTNGPIANLLLVMASVPEAPGRPGGITAFIIEADSPGVSVRHRNTFMGLRGIENGVTHFDRVRVPAGNRLGSEGQGLTIALTTLETGRLALAAAGTGAAKWCLMIAREWSLWRPQWGARIGQHEAVAGKIAYMAATTFALEAMLYVTSRLADSGDADIRIEVPMAKLYTSEEAFHIGDELVQIRGGRGYETADSLAARGERGIPAEQLLRDLRVGRIFTGSTEVMHLLIAREAMDAHISIAAKLTGPGTRVSDKARAILHYAAWYAGLLAGRGQRPAAFGEFGPLATHLRYAERASRRLARHSFHAMLRWRTELEHRQRFMARLVDIGTELFAMTASCTRARMSNTQGSDDAPVELADAFCRQARLRIDSLFRHLWDNTDERDRRLAQHTLDGRYGWLEDDVVDPSIPGPWIADGSDLSTRSG